MNLYLPRHTRRVPLVRRFVLAAAASRCPLIAVWTTTAIASVDTDEPPSRCAVARQALRDGVLLVRRWLAGGTLLPFMQR